MARPTNTPLDVRTPVDSRIQSPGLDVAAQPVNTVGAPVSAMDQQVNEFTRSMAAFTGGFDAVAQQQSGKMIEKQQQEGLKKEVLNYDPNNEPRFTMDQTPWYTEARMAVWAQRKSLDLSTDLKNKYDKLQEDPEAFVSTDINKWVSGQIQDGLKGLSDPVVLQNVMGHLTKTQAEIMAEATHKQEQVRNKKMVSDFGTVVESSLVDGGFSADTLDKLVTDAKSKHIPVQSIAPYILSAANYGITKGNYNAGGLLDTKLPSLNGLSLRMVAPVSEQHEFDAVLGKAQPKINEEKLQMFAEQSGNALGKGYSDSAVQDQFVNGMQLGLKRTDVVDTIVGHIKSLAAQGKLTPEQAAAEINKPRAFLDGGNILNATSEKGKADTMNNQSIAAQEQAKAEAVARQQALYEADIDVKLAQPDPQAAGLPLNNMEALAKMTLGNSMYAKNPEKAHSLFDKLLKASTAAQDDTAAQVALNTGNGRMWAFGKTEGEIRDAHLKNDQTILKSGVTEEQAIQQMANRGAQTGVASPYLKTILGGLSTTEPTIKDSQGQEVANPEYQKKITVLNAIRKSGNPQILAQYLEGPDLALANSVDIQTNEMGVNAVTAFKNSKLMAEPTHAEQLKRLTGEHREEIVKDVVGSVSKGVDSKNHQWFFDMSHITNEGEISRFANDLVPQYLAATGGDITATKEGIKKEIQQRVLTVATAKNAIFRDDGYAIVLPPKMAATKETAQAFQAFQDKQAAVYKGQGDVRLVPTNMSRDGAEYEVRVGGIPQGPTVTLAQILDQQSNTAANKARLSNELIKNNVSKDARSYATGDLTPQAYQQLQENNKQAAFNQFSTMMKAAEPLAKDIQGNPVGPVIKGTGPRSAYGIAAANAVDNPAFAIGAAVEGISQRAYKDNDGGITIGLGYNTKHQSTDTIKSDFSKAGIPNTDGFIQSILSGKAALTLPQQQALHGVAFKRYQDSAKKVFEQKYPGAWDGLDKYQQAAIGQLAYNTGWNSKVMNHFLDKVGSGHEEDAIRDLKIVWHDAKGGAHVNTDMMRTIRAMYQGPEAFKAALHLGK